MKMNCGPSFDKTSLVLVIALFAVFVQADLESMHADFVKSLLDSKAAAEEEFRNRLPWSNDIGVARPGGFLRVTDSPYQRAMESQGYQKLVCARIVSVCNQMYSYRCFAVHGEAAVLEHIDKCEICRSTNFKGRTIWIKAAPCPEEQPPNESELEAQGYIAWCHAHKVVQFAPKNRAPSAGKCTVRLNC